MAKLIFITLALVWVSLLVCLANGLPSSDEERFYDKEFNRDLVNWMSSMRVAQVLNNPCRFYAANGLTPPMPKRNSELINSLLSLPKNMNDAGK